MRAPHPKLQTYTPGERVGRWIVVRRVSNTARGNARWLLACAVCDWRKLVEGIRLRGDPPKNCDECVRAGREKRLRGPAPRARTSI